MRCMLLFTKFLKERRAVKHFEGQTTAATATTRTDTINVYQEDHHVGGCES
jgi:hypothetical protein